MATIRLEDLWTPRLYSIGWPESAIKRFKFAWAKTTLSSYNSMLSKCQNYCKLVDEKFPPESTGVVAGFLCSVADKSARPKSILGTACATM